MGALCVGLGMVAISDAHAPAVLLLGVALAGLGVGLDQSDARDPGLAARWARPHGGHPRRGAVLWRRRADRRSVCGAACSTLGSVPGAPFVGGAVAASISLVVAIALQRRPVAPYDGSGTAVS